MQRPPNTAGLHHVAIFVKDLEACEVFYTELLGMTVVWRPDPDNVYLTGEHDNFALHRAPSDFTPAKHQRLDHIGFFLRSKEDVDAWHTYLSAHQVTILRPPRDHRDGTRSFYCADPDGNVVQLICMG